MMKKLVQNYLLMAVMFGGHVAVQQPTPQHMRQTKFRLFQAGHFKVSKPVTRFTGKQLKVAVKRHKFLCLVTFKQPTVRYAVQLSIS